MPIVEHAEGGSSALTVRRLIYLTFITVPFAGLLTLIGALKKAGWVLDKQDGRLDDTPKDGIEFTPFVAPDSISLETINVTFFDEAGIRRAFWVMPENKENVLHDMMSSAETNTEDAIQLASKAEALGLQAIRLLAGKVET